MYFLFILYVYELINILINLLMILWNRMERFGTKIRGCSMRFGTIFL